jgi:hypothetical protein
MQGLRNPGPFLLTTLLSMMLSPYARAQTHPLQPAVSNTSSASESAQQVATSENILPDAPGTNAASSSAPEEQSTGSISGVVLDVNGADVEGADVTLQIGTSKKRTIKTDSSGLFSFATVEPVTFKITIAATGFASWISTDLRLQKNQSYELPPVVLQIESAMTNVDVNFTQHDIAEEQISLEEKQRVLGVFPNFYVVYTKDAVPLSSGQKFRLALRTSYDPVSFAIPAIIAGVEQSQNTFSGYGQGAQGYAKRYGASYGDGFIGNMIGNAILPSLLHQDPRYFYKGTGTIRSRALYAMSTAFICKGDNGRWQPNYSFILGNFAAAGLSNAYYPASDRNGAGLTITNALIDTASGAATSLIQEFLIKRISRGVSRGSQP